MLVLSRKEGQKIVIDKGMIQVSIVRIEGGQVRLGFSAPKNIDIDRQEIFIQKEAKRKSSLKAVSA